MFNDRKGILVAPSYQAPAKCFIGAGTAATSQACATSCVVN